MSDIRLLIDEDAMDRRFVNALRSRSVDVTSVGEMLTTIRELSFRHRSIQWVNKCGEL